MNTTFTLPTISRLTRHLPGRFRFLLALAALGGFAPAAQAQLQLSSSTPTTVDFNEMGTSTTAPVPAGFQLATGSTVSYFAATNTTATTRAGGTSGTSALNSSSGGGDYNFADGVTATSTDRALGFLSSSSAASPRHLLLAVQNTTGATIQDLQVAFDIEKYRTGSRAFEWQFYTSTDGTTWTAQPDGNQSFAADGANAVVNPAATTAKSVALTGLDLTANATYYLRWSYVGVGGSTNAQALGLDNLTLTPTLVGGTTPAPTPTASISTTASAYDGSYCLTPTAGSAAFAVDFTTTGTFTGAFKAQLSDANGTFPTSATANIIGTGTSSPISASIPAGTASGTGYRIRVINNAPATYGTDNGSDLTVTLAPASNPVSVAPSGSQTVSSTGTGSTLTATASAPSTFVWQYGTSASGPFTAISGATEATYTVQGSSFPGGGTYYLVAQATTTCGNVTGTSAPITVTVTAPTPQLSVSPTTLDSFGNVTAGAASTLQSFTVSGEALTSPIILTPPAGFEIRTGTNPFACCAITLQPMNGSVSSTTIEVRFAPTAAQPYQASIPVTSNGLPTQSVAVSGTGTAPAYPATLATAALTNTTATTTTTGGNVLNDGGSAVTARGVVWSTNANPALGTSQTTDGTGTGAFTSTITGLTPGTTYFVRAYATNGVSTAYGEEFSFTTVTVPLAAEPTAQSALAASKVTSTTIQLQLTGGNGAKHLVLAHLSGAVDAQPADATTYADSTVFGKGAQIGTGNYVVYSGPADTVTVSNLRPGTAYTFAVFDYNDNNTPYAENYLTTTPGTLAQTTKPVSAQLLLEENFDYPAGSLLTANNWTAHSGANTNAVTVTAGSLSYTSYGASNIGNAAALKTSGEDVNRQFATLYAGTPVYASFLTNVASTGTSGDYFFHLGPTSLGSTYKSRVYAKRGSSTSKVLFGISGNGSGITYSTTEYDVNTTYLLVVKYVFDENGSTSQLFVNPALDAEPATATAASTETSGSPSDIGSVALRQGSSSTAPALTVDGIRVGTTYKAVRTGITCEQPAPSFAATTACLGTATAFTDASKTVEDNATYAWDFDGDGQVDNTTAGNVTYTYAAAGTYKATLTITQGTCSAVYTHEVTVNAPPTLTVPTIAPVTVAYGQASASVEFAATATGSPAPTLTYTIIKNGVATPITSPYAFPVGSTTVTATAANSCTTTSKTFDVTVRGTAASVSVLYQNGNKKTNTNIIRPNLQLRNESSAAIAYSELTVRYWLTAENYSALQGAVDYAQVGTNRVQLRYVPLAQPVQGAFGYVEYSFAPAAGSLAAGSTSGPIQARFYKQDYTSFDETDDYSYAANSAYAANNHITVYRNGALVGGTEPTAVPAVSRLKVYTQNQSSSTTANSISTYLQLRNEGNTPVSYANLTVRYWLSPEGTSPLNTAVDYAALGTNNVQLTTGKAGTETYVELHFAAGLGSFAPLSSTGNVQYRVSKANWSAFDQANDYSYQPKSSTLAENQHVTAYLNGQLVYGQEPAGALSATATSSSLTLDDAATSQATLSSYPNPFSGRTTLEFSLPQEETYQLDVYDASGRLVQHLKAGTAAAGQRTQVEWQATNLAAGLYTARLTTAHTVRHLKLLLQ